MRKPPRGFGKRAMIFAKKVDGHTLRHWHLRSHATKKEKDIIRKAIKSLAAPLVSATSLVSRIGLAASSEFRHTNTHDRGSVKKPGGLRGR